MILTSSKFVAGPAGRCWNIGIMRDMVVILTPMNLLIQVKLYLGGPMVS